MAVGTVIAGLAALLWIVAVAIVLSSFLGAVLQPRIQSGRANATATPSISLILPVKLVNPGFERAQASVFDQDYPCYEVVVGAMEPASPALSIMRALVDASSVPATLVQARPAGAVSPKLDTLAAPLDSARHDVVVTKDSNISFAPATLRDLVRGLRPDVGLVCAVPVAVRAATLAGRIEAILINRDARLLLTASTFGKGYGVGKVMVFRRSDLQRAGGIAAIGYTIAEDTALSRALGAIGLRTEFAVTTVDQEIGARRLRDVYARQARWAVIRRAEEPVTFCFEPIACPMPAACFGALAAPLLGLAAATGFGLTLLIWYVLEVSVTALKGWEVRPWTPVAFLGRDAVLLVAWANAWLTREVTWAGRKQDVRDVLRKPGPG